MSAPEVVQVVSTASHVYAGLHRPIGSKYYAERRFLPPMLYLGWVKPDHAPTERTERISSTLPIRSISVRRSKKLGKGSRSS